MNTYKLTNRLFNDIFADWDNAFYDGDYAYWRRTANDIKASCENDCYIYKVSLAGFKKENIKVESLNGQINVVAKQGDRSRYNSFLIPEDSDISTLSASHTDGLLTVNLSKKEEAKAINVEIT
jgi:HSP20 family molecular chaperone IbpA